MNKAYHLVVEACSTRFGNLREKNSCHADVFFTHEEAYQKGKEVLTEKIQKLFEASDYCDGKSERTRKEHARDRAHHKPGKGTVNGFVEDGQVRYLWRITEIDLDRLMEYEDYDGFFSEDCPLIHIQYTYDYDGELLHRYYYWPVGLEVFSDGGVYVHIREGDDLPEAGTRFQVGDFVRLKRPMETRDGKFDTETVFVVYDSPQPFKGMRYWENIYFIETVSEDGRYLCDQDFHAPDSGIHENELVLHDGEVNENSPLWFLRRVHLGELGDIEEITEKLLNGEIALTPSTTWEELQCGSI
jgi:hypothetical protein